MKRVAVELAIGAVLGLAAFGYARHEIGTHKNDWYAQGQADAVLRAELRYYELVDSAAAGHGVWATTTAGQRVYFYSVPVEGCR